MARKRSPFSRFNPPCSLIHSTVSASSTSLQKIGIITGGISAGECVRKIGAAITRRHRRKIDSGLVQCFRFKRDRVFRNVGRIQLMPCLVEQRRRQVFGRFVTLIEFFRGHDFIEQRLRDRFAGLVMLGVILQHFRPGRPHLVHLRRILDEIARHARSAEARIFHVRKHSVQRVAEFVKGGAHFVVGEQRRLARRAVSEC